MLRRFPSAVTASSLVSQTREAWLGQSLSLPAPFGSVLVHANVFRSSRSHTARLFRPRDARHRKARARRCRRDWGEPRFTARFPLRRSGRSSAEGVFFPRSRSVPARLWHFCRFLLSKAAKTGSAECLVKGVRFPGPKCLPSPVVTRVPLGPRPERNRETLSFVRRSRDEDRRARVATLPFTAPPPSSLACALEAADGQAPVHAS